MYLKDFPLRAVPIVLFKANAGENEVIYIAGYRLAEIVIIKATHNVKTAMFTFSSIFNGQLISYAYVEFPITFTIIYARSNDTITSIADSIINPVTKDNLELPKIFLVFTDLNFTGICAMKKLR